MYGTLLFFARMPLVRGRGAVLRGVRVRHVRVRRRRGALPVPRAGALRHGLRRQGRHAAVALPRAGVRSVANANKKFN